MVANATSTNGLAAHYTTVIGAGGWMMKTPIDAATSEATSAVYYAPGFQPEAATIASSIGVKATQVLPVSSATPVSTTSGVDVIAVIGQARVVVDDHDGILLTLPDEGAAAAPAELPAPFWRMAAEPEHSALFLDFDGTLAAIVEDPKPGARPSPASPGCWPTSHRLRARRRRVASPPPS